MGFSVGAYLLCYNRRRSPTPPYISLLSSPLCPCPAALRVPPPKTQQWFNFQIVFDVYVARWWVNVLKVWLSNFSCYSAYGYLELPISPYTVDSLSVSARILFISQYERIILIHSRIGWFYDRILHQNWVKNWLEWIEKMNEESEYFFLSRKIGYLCRWCFFPLFWDTYVELLFIFYIREWLKKHLIFQFLYRSIFFPFRNDQLEIIWNLLFSARNAVYCALSVRDM